MARAANRPLRARLTQARVYIFASQEKIGSRPTHSIGTSRSWLMSRHLLPGGAAGQLCTTYSAAGPGGVVKAEKFATTTTS